MTCVPARSRGDDVPLASFLVPSVFGGLLLFFAITLAFIYWRRLAGDLASYKQIWHKRRYLSGWRLAQIPHFCATHVWPKHDSASASSCVLPVWHLTSALQSQCHACTAHRSSCTAVDSQACRQHLWCRQRVLPQIIFTCLLFALISMSCCAPITAGISKSIHMLAVCFDLHELLCTYHSWHQSSQSRVQKGPL